MQLARHSDSTARRRPCCSAAHDSGPHAASPQLQTRSRQRDVAAHVRRSKQYIGRKELQQQAKQEYIRRIYEGAERVEDDHLVFTLQPSSPRVRAELQEADQHAALNRQLAQQIPALGSWQELAEFVQQHGSSLNFLNVVALVSQAAAVQQQADAAGPAAEAPDPRLAPTLAVLVLEQSSWFQPAHFAASAAALCALGVSDPVVWDSLAAAAEHKVGAFTFDQLACTLEAMALAGFTPDLQWVERTHRQAGKHLHAAAAANVAVLLWAWGEMGYTPRDRLFMNQVKISTRRCFDQLPGLAMVQLLHGLARMPRYAPNPGWLAALVKAARPRLADLPAGALVDLLLSLVALGFNPPSWWMDAALEQLLEPMQAALNSSSSSSSSGPAGDVQQPQMPAAEQEQQLFFVPLELQQAAGQLLPEAPGVLLSGGAGDQQARQSALQPAPDELQQLEALFEDAAAAEVDAAAAAAASAADGGSAAAAGSEWQQQQPPHEAGDGPVPAAAAAAAQAGRAGAAGVPLSLPPGCRQAAYQGQLAVQDVGVLCWCLGRVQHVPPPSWMQALGQLLLAHCAAAPAEVLTDALLGCVAAGYLPAGPLQQQLLGALQQQAEAMPPECLRRLCQALGSYEAGLEEQQQQQQALPAWGTPGSGAPPPDASSCLARYRKHQRPALAAAVMQRQAAVLEACGTAQLADMLAFLAAAGAAPSLDHMAAVVARAVRCLPDGCPAPALCTLLWALARMGFKPHPQLLHCVLAALQRGLHLLSSQDLADAAWALSTLKHRPGSQWLVLFMKEVAAKAAYMQPQALTDTLWALACFAARPDREWLKGVAAAAGARAAAGALGRRNAAVVLWALAQLGFQPQQYAAGGGDGSGAVSEGVAAAVAGLVAAVEQ